MTTADGGGGVGGERIAILGAGRVATALAGGLRAAGAPVTALWARRPEAAAEAAQRAGVPAASNDELAEISSVSDVVVLAVSDRAIPELAARAAGALRARPIALHTSGAAPAADALSPLAGRARGLGTLHLLRAVSSGEEAMGALAGTHVAVEGDDTGRQAAARIGRAVGARVFELAGEDMAAYHAAAAIASNYAVALLDAAEEIAAEAGVPLAVAREGLADLAAGSVAGARARGPEGGLTGPIRRGDRQTVERHVDALWHRPALLDLYATMGKRAIALARRARGAECDSDLSAIGRVLSRARSRARARARARSSRGR